MFVPPYNAILKALGTTPQDIANKAEVTIPTKLFMLLLRRTIDNSYFNERGYLSVNHDVARAVLEGTLSSARDHYVDYGYFECRRGATPDVDEHWYRKANPDVASAIRRRAIASAIEHYQSAGADELRAPNEAYQEECMAWKESLERRAAIAR